MYTELEILAATYGDDLDEDGSVATALHRGWMSLKDALTGSSADGVLDVAEQGEDHAVSEYRKALEEDVSPELAEVIRRRLEARGGRQRLRAVSQLAGSTTSAKVPRDRMRLASIVPVVVVTPTMTPESMSNCRSVTVAIS